MKKTPKEIISGINELGINIIRYQVEFEKNQDNYNVYYTKHFMMKTYYGCTSELFFSINKIEKNGTDVLDNLSEEDLELVKKNVIIKRNHHYIPQLLLKLWTTNDKLNYFKIMPETRRNKRPNIKKELINTASVFSKKDLYTLQLKGNNNISCFEDGFISFIENVHIQNILSYASSINKSTFFDSKFIKENKELMKSIYIVFFYTIMITKKENIDDFFNYIFGKIEKNKINTYQRLTTAFANIGEKIFCKYFDDLAICCFLKLDNDNNKKFLLHENWILDMYIKDNKKDHFVIIPLLSDVGLLFPNNSSLSIKIHSNIDMHLYEINKSTVQNLIDNNHGIICYDDVDVKLIEDYLHHVEDGIYTNFEKSFLNIELNKI